jgi:pilus assembly protein CpaB
LADPLTTGTMAAKRYSIVFYAAILVALVATFGVYRVLEATKANARVATAPVVLAQKDMPEGATIDRMAVVVAQWPVGTIPAGAFTSVDSVAGRVTRVAVFKGEALVPGRLAPDGTGPGLEVKITPGKRAMSFRINDVSGIAGLIQPNSRVDILVVINGGEKGQLAKLAMENMRILAIAAATQRQDDGRAINASVATVEVTPEEAEKLAIVTSQGQIQLILRGYGDPDSAKTKGATSSQVVAALNKSATVSTEQPRPVERRPARKADSAPQPVVQQPIVQAPPPAPKPQKPDTNTVTVIRGTAVTQQKFADSTKKDSLSKARTP